MKKLIISILLSECICSYCYDTTGIKYFPLNLGNVYVYKYVRLQNSDTLINTTLRVQIVNEAVYDSHKYFYFLSTSNFYNQLWFRVDSTTGNKMKYTGIYCSYYGNESMDDSLSAALSNYFWTGCHSTYPNSCTSMGAVVLFGIQTEQKRLSYSYPHYFVGRTYVKNFGLYKYESISYIIEDKYTLKGCIINSVLYGDTTMVVGLGKSTEKTPIYFSLSQNYPNPFNPVTRIKYYVPKSSLVKLVIYDILGREIETLVSETQKPGSYEVTWDGSRYASGVYFYRLITDEYTETKKMVLIK